MLVIDFYTKRLLGPKEIAQRAAFQPQVVVPEPWLDLDLDEDITQQQAWIPDAPRRDRADQQTSEGQPIDGALPDEEERRQLDDYARWIARGRYRRQAAKNGENAIAEGMDPSITPVNTPTNPSGSKTSAGETSATETSATETSTNGPSLQDPADELRRAAQRLRDLAQELRTARLGLTPPNHQKDSS
ncbi:MAG: hypothetical protein AAF556_05510 [Pseudomonadota bacterium]